MEMTEAEQIFMAYRPVCCEDCGGKMFYDGDGLYHCADCGGKELDDYGIIRMYLEKIGPDSALNISKETGVDLCVVNMFLKDGEARIPEGCRLFIKCRRCGCSIRSGRYCKSCTYEMAGGLRGAYQPVPVEKPEPEVQLKEKKKRRGMQYWGV